MTCGWWLGGRASLRPRRAAAFISPVASALDAAHGVGLVHRDVKPANMLVDVGPGRPEHVYLSDFGLARGVLSVGGLTGAGQFLGTPDYAAPEQISGRSVDGRADQYALACVAYTLLSGSLPFEREEPMAVLYAHLSAPPPRVTSVRPDLPAAVDQVLARALAKAPEDRYGSCGAFADALREALGVEPYDSSAPARPPAPACVVAPASPGGQRTVTMVSAGTGTGTGTVTARDTASGRNIRARIDCDVPADAARSAAPAGCGGNLDRSGGRGSCLLRQCAGGERSGRRVDQPSSPRPRTAVPAFRDRGPHRAAQRVPPHRAGDRPDWPAHRSGSVAPARRADRRCRTEAGPSSIPARRTASWSTVRTSHQAKRCRCGTATASTWARGPSSPSPAANPTE